MDDEGWEGDTTHMNPYTTHGKKVTHTYRHTHTNTGLCTVRDRVLYMYVVTSCLYFRKCILCIVNMHMDVWMYGCMVDSLLEPPAADAAG